MNSKWKYLSWLALALFLLGCPPKVQEKVIAGEDYAPTVFEYGGIRVVHAHTSRSPVEVRLVFAESDSLSSGNARLMNQLGLAVVFAV